MNDGFSRIVYKKGFGFYALIFAAVASLVAGIIFVLLDRANVGSFRQQDALGASYIFFGLAIIAFLIAESYNFVFDLNPKSLLITWTHFFSRKTTEIPYQEIQTIDVNMIGRKLVVQTEDKSIVIRFQHARSEGEIPDTANLGNPNGTLREILNLKNEIERRVKLSKN